MQPNDLMVECPIRNAFDVRLPVNCYPGHRRSGKLGERVEVHIVDDCVHYVRNQSRKSGRQKQSCNVVMNLHLFERRSSTVWVRAVPPDPLPSTDR